jgi:ADP-ribose pyrophosphatase YjhB (NUDIX family)
MSNWTALLFVFAGIGALAYIKKQKMDKQAGLSDKTKEALQKAIDEKDQKTQKWIENSIVKGYEGVGVIPYVYDPDKKIFYFVLGINKKGEAEYPGGKVEEDDVDQKDTVSREVLEETGLTIPRDRFVTSFQVTGGTTGYPSYVFLVEVSSTEFGKMKSADGTFTSFILVQNVVGCDTVKDEATGKEYEVRKFNKKYVLPQIKDPLLAHVESALKEKLLTPA